MELHTERLILRPVALNDARALHKIMNDPEVTHNLLTPHPFSEDKVAEWIASRLEGMENRNIVPMVITLRGTDRVAGFCAFYRVSLIHGNAELVYWLGQEYWGQGYMTEAARRMIRFGFEEMGLERIYAGCFTRNKASARVLEKLGMKYEKCARHEYRKDNEFQDVYYFSILRDQLSEYSGDLEADPT